MNHLERRGKATIIAMAIVAAITFVSLAVAGWNDLPYAPSIQIIDRRGEWPAIHVYNWRHESVINMPANALAKAGRTRSLSETVECPLASLVSTNCK